MFYKKINFNYIFINKLVTYLFQRHYKKYYYLIFYDFTTFLKIFVNIQFVTETNWMQLFFKKNWLLFNAYMIDFCCISVVSFLHK